MSRSLAASAICHSLLSQVTRPPHPPAPCCVPAPCPWLGTGAAMTWCHWGDRQAREPQTWWQSGCGLGSPDRLQPSLIGSCCGQRGPRPAEGQLAGPASGPAEAGPRCSAPCCPATAHLQRRRRRRGGPPTRLLIDAVAQGWAREWGHHTAAHVPAGSSHRCSALGPRVPLPSPAPRPAPAWSCPSCSVGVWGPSPGLSFAAKGPELV